MNSQDNVNNREEIRGKEKEKEKMKPDHVFIFFFSCRLYFFTNRNKNFFRGAFLMSAANGYPFYLLLGPLRRGRVEYF